MPRHYKLHFDKLNKVWSNYLTDPRTKKRTKVIVGKGKSRTNDPKAYQAALTEWKRVQASLPSKYRAEKKTKLLKASKNLRPKDSMNGLMDRYLTYHTEQLKSDAIAHATFRNRRQHLSYFLTKFIKEQVDDTTIDDSGGAPAIIRPSLVINYYRFLCNRISKQKMRRSTAALRFNTMKHFISYCCVINDLVEMPTNLYSSEYAFRTPRKERYSEEQIIVFTPTELQDILSLCLTDKFHNQVALWVSLSLNCAWTIADLASLKLSHIEKRNGATYIIKPRLKTAIQAEFRLWDDNAKALDAYIQRYFINPQNEQLVFLSKHGKPIFEWLELIDERGKIKISSRNRGYSAWRNAFDKAGVKKAFRYLRKTSASAMEEIADDHRFVQKHLAHKPASLAGQVYSTGVNQQRLDGYVMDLPRVFGIQSELGRLSSIFNMEQI